MIVGHLLYFLFLLLLLLLLGIIVVDAVDLAPGTVLFPRPGRLAAPKLTPDRTDFSTSRCGEGATHFLSPCLSSVASELSLLAWLATMPLVVQNLPLPEEWSKEVVYY